MNLGIFTATMRQCTPGKSWIFMCYRLVTLPAGIYYLSIRVQQLLSPARAAASTIYLVSSQTVYTASMLVYLVSGKEPPARCLVPIHLMDQQPTSFRTYYLFFFFKRSTFCKMQSIGAGTRNLAWRRKDSTQKSLPSLGLLLKACRIYIVNWY